MCIRDSNDHVASIEHYEYKVPEGTGKEVEGLTREELANVEWKDYAWADIEADSKSIVYAKITDDAGNYIIINLSLIHIYYDPGASEVNQLNRIKLMLSTAQKNLEKEEYMDPNLAKTLKKVEELSSKRVNKCRL